MLRKGRPSGPTTGPAKLVKGRQVKRTNIPWPKVMRGHGWENEKNNDLLSSTKVPNKSWASAIVQTYPKESIIVKSWEMVPTVLKKKL